MDIERALKIPGWMNPKELTWLAEQAAKHHFIAEVGSWMGRSTTAMADNTAGFVYAIDTWKGTVGDPNFPQEPSPDYFWNQFSQNIGPKRLSEGNVRAMRMTSLEAAAKFAEQKMKLGMVFIDGAHDYENVRNDILAWRPLVQEGGLLCGHDYDWGYPGVVHAVRELIAPVPKQAANGSSIWYMET